MEKKMPLSAITRTLPKTGIELPTFPQGVKKDDPIFDELKKNQSQWYFLRQWARTGFPDAYDNNTIDVYQDEKGENAIVIATFGKTKDKDDKEYVVFTYKRLAGATTG